AELRRDRCDQQGSERANLRVLRPGRRRRRAPRRSEADRARQAAPRAVKPSDFPAPFDARNYVTAPTDPVDERIEVGVLVVGGGRAGCACAIRLGQVLEERPELRDRLGEVPIAVLDKGKQAGSHLLSGAVVNPRGLRRLFRGRKRIEEMPFYGPVLGESVYF